MCQVQKSTPRAKIVLKSPLLLLQNCRFLLKALCGPWELDDLYHSGYQHYGGPKRGCCGARVPPALQPVHGFPNRQNVDGVTASAKKNEQPEQHEKWPERYRLFFLARQQKKSHRYGIVGDCNKRVGDHCQTD